MPFGWAAAAAAAAGLASSYISSDASKSAAGSQSGAANQATAVQQQMAADAQKRAAPYQQTGYQSLSSLARGVGGQAPVLPFSPDPNTDAATALFNRDTINSRGFALRPDELQDESIKSSIRKIQDTFSPGSASYNPDNQKFAQEFQAKQPSQQAGGAAGPDDVQSGQFTHQFNAGDLNSNLAPNWKFALEQGQGAAANALNLSGGTGGNFAKGLVDYTLNNSGDLYQNAFANYSANQTNIFNRLASIAGIGQTANAQSGQVAVGLAPGISSSIQGAGAAQAAGTVGQANAISGGINNAASWYGVSQIAKPQSGSNSGADPNFTGDASRSLMETG